MGEALACDFLQKQHYRILARNVRCPGGEIDIVACIDEYLVFCEVKTRNSGAIHPSAAITTKKIEKLHQLGLWYMEENNLYQWQPRFDVVAIQLERHHAPKIEHFINAL